MFLKDKNNFTVSKADTLTTARTVNGTNFNGSANITTANWGTARNITIGNTAKSVNGSANVSWSLSEIGAAAASHTHSYAPISHEQDYAGTNSNTYIAYPKDGRYRTTTSSLKGYLKITLPQTWTSTMMRFEVDVYNYLTNETMTYIIGGYNYSANSTWTNYSACCISHSGNAKRNLTVRFGHDGTKCAIYIGEASTTWAYTQVTVKNITVGYSNNSLTSWNSGWVVGFTTTLGTVTGTVTNPYVGNGGMASTANTLATARTINGTSFNGSGNITTANWGTARTLTIGNTAKSVNGSANVAWSLSEIGALPLSGGTLSGDVTFNKYLKINAWSGYGTGTANFWYDGSQKTINVEGATKIKLNGTEVAMAGQSVPPKSFSGDYINNFRTFFKGDSNSGPFIATIRTEQDGLWRCPVYGTGLAFGMGDTHVYFHTNWKDPEAYIGGGSGNKLNWVEKISFDGHKHDQNTLVTPTFGNYFNGGAVTVSSDGVMEAGKYMDFHNSSGTTNDYSTRLQSNGDTRNVVYLPTGTGDLGLMHYTNSYWGLAAPNGDASNWIRTTVNGLIPYQSGGYSSIGTDTWPFTHVYANHLVSKAHASIQGYPLSIQSSAPTVGGIWIQI